MTLLTVLCFAALSRRLAMSVVTMPIVFTALGYGGFLAGAELFPKDAEFEILHLLAEITLVLVLFSDASQVRFHHLRMSGGIPARMLLIAMPLSIVLGTLVAHWVSPDQPWALALLVAAILTPTDAALGQAVVSDASVPGELREGIAVESGLNDGLALPVVIIAALAAAEASGVMADGPDNLIAFGMAQITLGPLAGAAVGALAALVMDLAVRRKWVTESYRGIYFLSTAFLCFIAAELIGGNGLIAAFVGGLTFGNMRKSASKFVSEFMESEGQLLTMATFLIFGMVLAPAGLDHASWKTVVLAIAFLTAVRIVPVVLSLTGTKLRWRDKLFLGWFGPRGLASILFALLVAEGFDIPGMDEVIACMVLTVLISIVLHGASAFPIVRAFSKDTSDDSEMAASR
ncbi:sodium:proton antiporter [Altererythrobacter aestiaquae]|uniref:Sodium:proton antiporter n=1 Tax=Pontixanthobacter aestiaquae TaxID=1509367 RepID=A0A844Z3J6_9SPHN|nr:sodium:proton antiporter [Pontixanthobacter aestiaquae]